MHITVRVAKLTIRARTVSIGARVRTGNADRELARPAVHRPTRVRQWHLSQQHIRRVAEPHKTGSSARVDQISK